MARITNQEISTTINKCKEIPQIEILHFTFISFFQQWTKPSNSYAIKK